MAQNFSMLMCLFGLMFYIIPALAVIDGDVAEMCSEYDLKFECEEDETVIAVKEAWVHDRISRVPKHKCHIPEYNVQFKRDSVLQHINRKCAMQKTCSFNVFRDIVGAKDEKEKWNGHVIRVVYKCVREDSFVRTCGERVEEQHGWIQNVRYPKFYLGPGACTYTIAVNLGQKVILRIYDLSTREIVRPMETGCRDFLTVTEGSDELFRDCGTLTKPVKIKSRGNVLNMTLHSSKEVYPKRGFMAEFNATGCPTPRVPEDGYLSHRNSTHAEFWCCVRHVFPDDMKRVRTLNCKYEMFWDQPLPDCVDLEDLLISGNITEYEYMIYNGSVSANFLFMDKKVVYDYVLPSLIMGLLVVGNGGILFLIILCKRRIKGDEENPEELESIKAGAEPTDMKEDVSAPCQV